jgi:hypothetical protein
VAVRLDVPPELMGRGIHPPAAGRGFRLSLDAAEPWCGGAISGRVELDGEPDPRPITVAVTCHAAWIDIAPQAVGKGRSFSPGAMYDLRARHRGIWLDEPMWQARVEVGALDDANWRRFAVTVPDGLPRAVEGTFTAFRYAVTATRRRRLGQVMASVPILLVEQRTVPVIRIERSPTASWRLIEWRAPDETGGRSESVEISFDERRPEDAPRAGETPEQELLRLVYRRGE